MLRNSKLTKTFLLLSCLALPAFSTDQQDTDLPPLDEEAAGDKSDTEFTVPKTTDAKPATPLSKPDEEKSDTELQVPQTPVEKPVKGAESKDAAAQEPASPDTPDPAATDAAKETKAPPPKTKKQKAKKATPPKPKVIPKKPIILKDETSLKLVVDLMQTIKDDTDYHSFDNMLDDVKGEHTIKYHKPNAPFFYTNDNYVLKDIITMVMIDPNGIIDESKCGAIRVYRDFEYHDELEDIFDQEPLYRRDLKVNKQFQSDYLGQTNTGPTNRVMITLKIKGDERHAHSFAKRIEYTGNNIDFYDAFPAKGLPPCPKPQKGVQNTTSPK